MGAAVDRGTAGDIELDPLRAKHYLHGMGFRERMSESRAARKQRDAEEWAAFDAKVAVERKRRIEVGLDKQRFTEATTDGSCPRCKATNFHAKHVRPFERIFTYGWFLYLFGIGRTYEAVCVTCGMKFERG